MPTDDTLGRQGPWHFERYVNGVHMAEGVEITRAASEEEAIRKAAALCPKRTGTVLVLRRNSAPALLACVRALEKTRQLVADCAASGFTDEAAVTALYENNGAISVALAALEAGE